MALTNGAWIFGSTQVTLASFSEANALTFATDLRTAFVTSCSGSGWSAGSSEFSWTGFNASRVAALADCDHTGGSKLWLGVSLYNAAASTTFSTLINAANYGNAGNLSTAVFTPALLVAYWPSGSGVTLASNPGTTNSPYTTNQTFVSGSVDPLRIVGSSHTTPSLTSGEVDFYYASQDDTVWFAYRHTSGSAGLRPVLAAGKILVPSSATDVSGSSTYGIARLGAGNDTGGLARASQAGTEIQCYSELDSTAHTAVLASSAHTELTSTSVQTASPWSLVPVYAYAASAETWPGLKGHLDPALVMGGPTSASLGERVGTNSQHTHVGGGLFMGYQSGSGDWYP